MSAHVRMFVRNAALERVAEVPHGGHAGATFVLKTNGVGSWSLEGVPDGSTVQTELDQDMAGLDVTMDDEPLFSGFVARPEHEWEEGAPDAHAYGGPDDKILLDWGLAYPDPVNAATAQAVEQDVRTGLAGAVMGQFVDANIGPGARSERRASGLSIPGSTLGTSVTGRGNFQTLTELLAELAAAGGDLLFDVVRSGVGWNFVVSEPVDRTLEVKFSKALGNLGGFLYAASWPTTNHVIAGDKGEGPLRVHAEREDGASVAVWRRRESFVNAQQTDAAGELQQQLAAKLLESVGAVDLRLTPVDTGGVSFWQDYRLGDRVTVLIGGLAIAQVVREVKITVDPAGVTHVEPVLASPGNRSAYGVGDVVDVLVARVVDLEQRLSKIERER